MESHICFLKQNATYSAERMQYRKDFCRFIFMKMIKNVLLYVLTFASSCSSGLNLVLEFRKPHTRGH